MKIDHIGIATRGIQDAMTFYLEALGLHAAETEEVAEQKVRVAMIPIGESRIELLEATSEDSPIARFLEKRGPGIHHVNHQVESNDDVLRSYYHLSGQRVPIVFGPGRHPTSGARFLYFKGPDGMVFEYSVGVDEIEDEATHRPRQFGFEPSSLCMWGSRSAGVLPPNS